MNKSLFHIQPLTIEDIPAAMQLVEAAGWNQVPADWQRVIEYQPWGCFKAAVEDRLVGTVTSTSYGDELAWIGMMLVDPDWRRQGLGRALMQQAIRALQSAHMQTIKLDATPAGRPLYEQLGFVAQFDFQRWRRGDQAMTSSPLSSMPERIGDYDQLDLAAFGVNRQLWLSRLAADSLVHCQAAGFGMLRRGRIADYLGPIVSDSADAAFDIIAKLVANSSSTLFWDIPRQDEALYALARKLGFEPVRVLTRMVLGSDSIDVNLGLQYAISDPATG